MAPFVVFPAIDLVAGRVVRLAQGDPNRQTVYADDPAGVAQRWLLAGASWLHVVNLDGALDSPDAANLLALESILSVTAGRCRVQFGGGLRSLDTLDRLLALGVSRAVLGTAAVEAPTLAEQAVRRYGSGRVAVSIDTRDGKVQTHGWTQSAAAEPVALGQRMHALGVRTVVYTDAARDGVGAGVNVEASRQLAEETGLSVIAAGGVASLEDVRLARRAGLAGIIVGRALYTGQVDLAEALSC